MELAAACDMRIGADTAEVWQSIVEHEGSVQHLAFLTADEKDI